MLPDALGEICGDADIDLPAIAVVYDVDEGGYCNSPLCTADGDPGFRRNDADID